MENFEKLKLSVSIGSEPNDLDYFYDLNSKQLKRPEFFLSNINIDKTFWCYLDKYEDVSIYFYRNEYPLIQPQSNTSSTLTNNMGHSMSNIASTAASISVNNNPQSNLISIQQLNPHSLSANNHYQNSNNSANLFASQKFENFNDKLKLWKCVTLIKHPNIKLEKILNRIKNERFKLLINLFIFKVF